MDKSSNPVLSDKAMKRLAADKADGEMTVSGSLGKTGYALLLVIAAAIAGWLLVPKIGVTIPGWWLIVILVAAPITGFIAVFRPNALTVTLYALLEGLLLGIISRAFEGAYDGIVTQAILLTLAVSIGMFVLYASGLVQVTSKLRSVIVIATVGVLLYFLATWIISFFAPGFISILSTGTTGIIIAAIIVVIAALNLLLDFDFISRGAAQQLPKKAEWYAAFGLMVTLIWLYLSILRLLAASRR